jgi:hypothetical protein
MRTGQAWPEELALQALCPIDHRAGFGPHKSPRIAGRHASPAGIWMKAKRALAAALSPAKPTSEPL